MSDHVPDTPSAAEVWCPGCCPDRDPLREVLEERLCHRHQPTMEGTDDGAVSLEPLSAGAGEAEASNCRAAAALIR